MKLYTTKQAARYLGNMSIGNLRYHVTQGHLQPDIKVGGNFLFMQGTLDTFRKAHQTEGLSLEEAATYLGVTPNRLKYHVFQKKAIAPTGKRGNHYTFSKESLDSVRDQVTAPYTRARKAVPEPT